MATWYVNSITGNDGNSGATPELAKLTLASVVSAATAGDTIYCHGLFVEALATTKQLIWIGSGYCCWDGANTYTGSFAQSAYSRFKNITFTRWLGRVFGTQGCVWENCNFFSNPGYAIDNYGSVSSSSFTQCVFADNGSAFGPTSGPTLLNCVLVGNGYGLESTGYGESLVRYCVLRNTVNWKTTNTGSISVFSDYNVYDFAFGKNIYGGVDKTTLAAWQASVGTSRDANSIDRAWSSDVCDYTNRILRSNPSSYLLTAGPGSTPIGLTLPAVTISNNKNASLWTGGVFSNTEIDGSGYLVLSAGQTSGYWRSDIIDFGASINAKALQFSAAGQDASNFLRYSSSGSPGYYDYRIRGSNASFAKGDASPSWFVVPFDAEIGSYMSNALRYWQVELTLRGP